MHGNRAEIPIWRGRDKEAGRRVWAIFSYDETEQNGFPSFHLVYFDYRAGKWICTCDTLDCRHLWLATVASKSERGADVILHPLTLSRETRQSAPYIRLVSKEA